MKGGVMPNRKTVVQTNDMPGSIGAVQVKRFAFGVAGFLYGLIITWVCLAELSRLHEFRDPHKVVHGCTELDKCPFPWYGWLILGVYIFGPAALGAALNAYALHRWSVKRWGCYAALMTGVVVTLYFGGAFFSH
jgi:hypothetical protein